MNLTLPNNDLMLFAKVTKIEFWALWMKFISEESFSRHNTKNSEKEEREKLDESILEEANISINLKENVGFLEKLHARYAPSRKMKHIFLQDQIRVIIDCTSLSSSLCLGSVIEIHFIWLIWQERYEAAFELTAGSLKSSIPSEKLADYIQVLAPLYPYRVSSYNVAEFLDLFGRNGTRSKEIMWADIRKVLREHKAHIKDENSILIESVFNPTSWVVSSWFILIKLLATYHFIMVPIRISFLLWNSMLDPQALGTDLIADILTVANVFVLGNTAYMGSRATWITKRAKIFRRIDLGYIIAAVPLDW